MGRARRRSLPALLSAVAVAIAGCGGGTSRHSVTPGPSGGSGSTAPSLSVAPSSSASASATTGAAARVSTRAPSATAGATTGVPESAGSTAASPAWPTYGGDLARSSRIAGPVGPRLRHQWSSPHLDGAIYAQPLLYANTVIVATEHDSLYGLDATTGQVRWHTNVGQPVPQSELPCGDIDPSGITSTPVIDTTTGLVWAVAFVEPHRHELIALDATTGALRSRRAVDGTGSDPTVQQQRSALALSRGRIYVAYGGLYGDCGQYHGWVVAAPVNGGPLLSWQVPSGREAGIWAPGGPTIDSSGDLFVTTGNSASSSRYDDGNSVIRLSPDLVPQDSFAPTDWVVMNATDGDLGSTSPALVGPGLVFQVGKTGTGYLLRAGHLGGVGGQLFSGPVCGSGGGAYGATAWVSPILYVPCTDGLVALRINASSFQVVWHGPSGSAGPPSVTGATVWTVAGGSDQLVALDAATGTRQASYPTGGVPHFASLGVGGGRILIPSGASIEAFGA